MTLTFITVLALQSSDPFVGDYVDHYQGGDRIRPPPAEDRIEDEAAEQDSRNI